MNVSLNVHNIIRIANTIAAGGPMPVGAMPVHLLYGCCAVGGCLANKYLAEAGINLETIAAVKMVHRPDMTVAAVLKDADQISSEFGNNAVVSEALLFVLSTACLQTVEVIEAFGQGLCKKIAHAILEGAGINPNNFTQTKHKAGHTHSDLADLPFSPFGEEGRPNMQPAGQSTGQEGSVLPPDLLDMGCDLTAKAKAGKIENIIGRDDETSRVIEILCRKTKNNPVLIGEAGVGKSSIVEGLALRINSDAVPKELKGKTIFSLDIGSMMAGTKYRGELEARLKKLIQFVTTRDDIILFIDELHQITTATGKEGEIGISEMLKPRLARGEMQTIGATTTEEYRKFIEKDAALERRFQPIIVEPPSVGVAIEILNGRRDDFEKFHGVHIGQDAIVAAVSLSDRYINDRNLPDKAIDMLDEACSRAKIAKQTQSSDTKDMPLITAESIAEVVSSATGVPVKKLTSDERESLTRIEEELQKHIVGQDKAISYIARAIRRSRAGVADTNRPVGSFMFLGRTGVGKTELCKVLAQYLFNSEKSLIKLDMSEFSESHSVSKLIGSPPGYVGYDDAAVVCERVRRNPYCIVLFDEIEKAHPDVYNVLLQILDEGRLTDNRGKTTSFRNAIIIMTSNVGVENLSRSAKMGFGGEDDITKGEEEAVMAGLRKRFRPEFINRIDNVVVFASLTKQDAVKITEILTDNLAKKLQGIGITLFTSKAAVQYLVDKGFNSEYGARPLKRLIQTEIEDRIAEEILATQAKSVKVDFINNELTFKFG